MRRELLFVPAPEGAYDSWRTAWPAEALSRRGFDVGLLDLKADPFFDLREIDLGPRHVIVVHVKAGEPGARMRGEDLVVGVSDHLARWRRSGARIVVNLDDDWTSVPEILDEVGPSEFMLIADVLHCCRIADAVVVSTDALVDVYAPYSKSISVVRNYPPARLWSQRFSQDRPYDLCYPGWLVGETGKPTPHFYDLQEIAPALSGRSLFSIGNPDIAADVLCPDGVSVSGIGSCSPEPQPGVPFLYAELAHAKIGLAPLAGSRFDWGKSWIKPLEFAISGTPTMIPAWHPAYQELGRDVPLVPYKDLGELSSRIAEVLAMPEEEYAAWSTEIREAAREMTIEARGLGEWEESLSGL